MSLSCTALQGLRILVVEDEAFILMAFEDMLHEFKCEIVGSVSTVEAALQSIQENELDGAILDMNLNGESIVPVAEALLARGVHFILCTGYPKSAAHEASIRTAPRLVKPFSQRSLYVAMKQVFGRN